jgi:hypothetical protein
MGRLKRWLIQKGSVEGVGDEKMGDGWRVSEAGDAELVVVLIVSLGNPLLTFL